MAEVTFPNFGGTLDPIPAEGMAMMAIGSCCLPMDKLPCTPDEPVGGVTFRQGKHVSPVERHKHVVAVSRLIEGKLHDALELAGSNRPAVDGFHEEMVEGIEEVSVI